MKLYLAGPMRGFAAFNHPAFFKAAALLRNEGHGVFCPAENDVAEGLDATGLSGEDGELASAGLSLRGLLGTDLAWITGEADGLVMMPGWEASAGARAEASTALAIGLPVWELARFLLYGDQAQQVMNVPAAVPS